MKLQILKWFLLPAWVLSASLPAYSQQHFKSNFNTERLRLDFALSGDADTMMVIKTCFFREPIWGGSRINLVDTFQYGDMLVEMKDPLTGEIIYSRGFSTIFQEWQTTGEASEHDTLFTETIVMPFPKRPVSIILQVREKDHFVPLYTEKFDPVHSAVLSPSVPAGIESWPIRESGPPENKLDILFLSEGYTMEEKDKFLASVKKLTRQIFNSEPWNTLEDAVNITAVFVPSKDSGTDIPSDSLWLNTALHTSFGCFGSERYLMPMDRQQMCNVASSFPWDQLCILINSERYGGGGIYNQYTLLTSGSEETLFLFTHEFGHSFGALADEYFNSSVPYSDFFDLTIEPYQPNITTLVDFDHKWKAMVPDSIPVPTPDLSCYDGVVGVFEGAGYSAKGIYRSYRNCVMKSRGYLQYCPVCRKAIRDMILFYAE